MRESLVAIAIALAGCSNGSFQDCAIACTETTGCPDGYSCGSEGVCRLAGAAGLCADDPMTLCRPGITAACYTGAAGTKDVGACIGGTRTCEATGTWGPCEGEIVPIAEVCGDEVDNDCNGVGDELDDQDGDGFATCSTPNQPADCCDTSADCDDPAQVNPGAFDIAGNGVDDDCNTVTDDATSCDDALASSSTSAHDFAKAIELCRRTTTAERTWGVITAKISLTSGNGTPDREGHAIRPQFGPGVTPRAGDALAIISTGGAAAKADTLPGYHAFSGYTHLTGPTSTFPADWLAANNNVLPKTPGCPQPTGTSALDPVMLTFHIRVPTNARSFELVSSFFAADFPEYTCSALNDYFLILLDSSFSGAPANPADKNLAFARPGSSKLPISVNLAHGNTGLFTACLNGATGCASGGTPSTITTCESIDMLEDTGFDDPLPNQCAANSVVGGATGWLVTKGNVVPGETITLRIAVWDMGDSSFDSLAVLDGFRWKTTLATPGTTPL